MSAAHNDNRQLIQPDVYESKCVQKWNKMSAHFAHHHTHHTRPLMYEDEPTELHVNLTVSLTRFQSDYVEFNTRAFNGKIPAPTIKVCPGDTLIVHVRNALEPGDTNRTNLHVHGLHVRPDNNHDNVLASIEPGSERVYEYLIRPDHPSGSFWYHPHSRGLINTQLSGMMAGSLIVVDRPDAFPRALARMDDLVLILQGVCIDHCKVEDDNLVQALQNHPSSTSSSDDFPIQLQVDPQSDPLNDNSLVHVHVNGQYLPEISMQPEEWKRFRYLNAVPNNMIELIVSSSACEMILLAWDGVYVDTPKKKNVVILPPGGRSDVAVRCLETGLFYVEIDSSPTRTQLLGKVNHHRVASQRIVFLRVTGDPIVPKMVLPTQLPPRPSYMQDLLSLQEQQHTNTYNYEFSVWMDHHTKQMKFGVNQQSFDPFVVNHTMRIDQVQEWELSVQTYCLHQHHSGSTMPHCHSMPHPFHMHATHYQITRMDQTNDPEHALFDIGEWRDTIPLFQSNVQIRFIPTSHMIGPIMTHCHFAAHSDKGMAQLVEVVGS